MDYLRRYNLSSKDIEDIKNKLDEQDILEIEANEERVNAIIQYFYSRGIKNIKDIFMCKPSIFYDSVESIKERLDKCDVAIINLINEDAYNFDLIGI